MVITKQTMNINDEDIDLRLSLGSRNYSAETRLKSSSSGAGVNAISRTDMPFPASDPLSELVWSPHNGLSLKCANSTLADNRPFFAWNMGQSTLKVSTSPTMVDGGKATVFRSSSSSSDLDARKTGEAGATDAIQKAQIADIAESSKRSAEQDSLEDNGDHDRRIDLSINWKFPSKLKTGTYSEEDCRLETHASKSDIMGLAVAIRSIPHAAKAPNQDDIEVTSASGDVNKRLESSDENELSHLAAKEARMLGETDSRICLYREKGKEKASSEVDVYARSSNNEDNSQGSMESCNSTGLFSKGIKRRHYGEEAEIMGRKRMRKQIHGSHACTPTVKSNSSFLSWISNMVKGLPDSNKDESSPPALTNTDCTRPKKGFQTVFQSLYSRGANASRLHKESLKNHPEPFDGTNINSCKQIILSDKDLNPHVLADSSERTKASEFNKDKGELSPSASLSEKVNSTEKTSPKIPLPMSCMPEKSSPLSSLWITRLYLRTATLENCSSDCSKADLDSRANDVLSVDQKISEAKDDFKPTHKLSPVRSSEAMTSVFAKRIDALRHIVHPSGKRRSPTRPLMCFYCGTSGHDLRQCPELTESELQNLLLCPDHKPSRKRLSTSSNSEHHLKDKQIFRFLDAQNVVPLEEMFHTIRKLRLSRADILRWMNSNVPLSHLNGFFLRLRLGKLEGGGQGGTSYYVACIKGDTLENIGCNSIKSILVDVGGIKSSVGSQYISNHDFLEHEVKAWWGRIVKGGGKIPSLDELKSKLKDRKRLGV